MKVSSLTLFRSLKAWSEVSFTLLIRHGNPMRVLIAGGGTGGHVIPALAIARELKTRYQAEVLFVGTARGIENRLVPAAGFGLMNIKVGALNNVSLMTRLRTLIDLPMALVRARKIILVFAPDVVVGVGGYASGPAMAAAILGRVPTLAFEPNYVPGFANKIVGHRVSAAAVHFEQTAEYFRNAQVVGVPVRQEFFRLSRAGPGRRPTLLVFGGSQGAHAINVAAAAAVPEVLRQLPDYGSSIRRVSATIMTCALRMNKRELQRKSRSLLMTCRVHLRRLTCWFAGQEQALWRKQQQQESRLFLFRCLRRRMIISAER